MLGKWCQARTCTPHVSFESSKSRRGCTKPSPRFLARLLTLSVAASTDMESDLGESSQCRGFALAERRRLPQRDKHDQPLDKVRLELFIGQTLQAGPLNQVRWLPPPISPQTPSPAGNLCTSYHQPLRSGHELLLQSGVKPGKHSCLGKEAHLLANRPSCDSHRHRR